MLIANKQIDTLNSFFFNDFIDRMCSYLASQYPRLGSYSPADLKSEVIKLTNEAFDYQIYIEKDLADYIELRITEERLKDISKNAELIEILTYPNRESYIKILLLHDYLSYNIDEDTSSNPTNKEAHSIFNTIV